MARHITPTLQRMTRARRHERTGRTGRAAAFLWLGCVASNACGDEVLPQDICSWLSDPNGCYARFGDDVGTQCGNTFVPQTDPVASATGAFSTREELESCIKTLGGQVVFDPPLDVAKLDARPVAFKLLDKKAAECGSGSFNDANTFAITIKAAKKNPPIIDPDAQRLKDDITGGTFSTTRLPGREVIDIGCPGGSEKHHFNTLILRKCADKARLLPTAIYDFSPGIPEGPNQPSTPGFVRLRVLYPPEDRDTTNNADGGAAPATTPATPASNPRVVEYFNCLIPAPPPPCQDGERNGLETAVDCGGTCPAKCGEGQGCNVNADCLTDHCEINGGVQQCVP